MNTIAYNHCIMSDSVKLSVQNLTLQLRSVTHVIYPPVLAHPIEY